MAGLTRNKFLQKIVSLLILFILVVGLTIGFLPTYTVRSSLCNFYLLKLTSNKNKNKNTFVCKRLVKKYIYINMKSM